MLPGGTSSKFRTGEDRDLISSWPICWANIAGIPWPSKIAGNDPTNSNEPCFLVAGGVR